MLNFNFCVRNPWSTRFKNIWCKVLDTPFKHKFIELEMYQDSSILSFMFDWTIRQSHAGLHTEIGILGFCLRFNFYDNRHWNHNFGQWET